LEAIQTFRQQVHKLTIIPDEDWELIMPHLSLKTFRRHDYFAREGKTATEVAMVVHGSFRHFYTKDGEEKTTYFYFEEALMSAYISCITQKPSLLSIQALEEAEVLVFPYKILFELFEKSKAWERFGRKVAEYAMMGLEERMVGLLMQSPEERYIELLRSNKKKIIERIPQHYIANYLGITPVSLSRIRNRVAGK